MDCNKYDGAVSATKDAKHVEAMRALEVLDNAISGLLGLKNRVEVGDADLEKTCCDPQTALNANVSLGEFMDKIKPTLLEKAERIQMATAQIRSLLF